MSNMLSRADFVKTMSDNFDRKWSSDKSFRDRIVKQMSKAFYLEAWLKQYDQRMKELKRNGK